MHQIKETEYVHGDCVSWKGGQGAVTAAEIMVKALSLEGKYGQSQAKLGIGDVTRVLPQVSIQAFHRAMDEMAEDRIFKGYGPGRDIPF